MESQVSGSFIGIVGPSGSGKDAVIADARARIEAAAAAGAGAPGSPSAEKFEFVRRVITREPGPTELSEYASPVQFAAREASGEFVLSWHAHGLAYGISASAVDQVDDGTVVVANLSRTVLHELPQRFTRSHTVLITVSDEVRRERLAMRARESDAAAQARLNRPNPAPDFDFDLTIVNDATIAEAGERLAQFLFEVARGEAH